MTGRLDRRVCHVCELIVDGQVASGLFVVDVPIEVHIDRDHEVVIAIIGCRDRYFGSVRSSKEFLDQVVTTQVAGLVVIVILHSSVLVGFSGGAFPSELERTVKVRLVVDADWQLGQVCGNHGQSIAGIPLFRIQRRIFGKNAGW